LKDKKERRGQMLDMPRALRVTENCIRVTAGLFPPSNFPFGLEDVLLRLGIDNVRIDLLKKNIAGNTQFGLASLTPPRKINLAFLTIDETSTVADVFNIVRQNAVLDLPAS
jgi:hypothetical protein